MKGSLITRRNGENKVKAEEDMLVCTHSGYDPEKATMRVRLVTTPTEATA